MSVRLLIGDCRDVLRTLPDESVHCVVTSPPYFGLRDYGTAKWDGGDERCKHINGALVSRKSGLRNDGRAHVGPYDGEKTVTTGMPFNGDCGLCGARRIDSQIGLEPTPDAYVAELVAVFRDVRRVLRKDGTCWLNLGSSHASADTRPSQFRNGALAYDSGGKALPGSPDAGHVCPDCGGGLTACSLSHRDRTAGISRSNGRSGRAPAMTSRDSASQDYASTTRDASAHDVQSSTILASFASARDASDLAEKASVYPSEQPTFFDDGRQSARKSDDTSDTVLSGRPSIGRKWDKAFVCTACGYSTRMYPRFKPKDLIPIPWMVAMALQRDGWYLRQDIIWSKPNPMPESVTDRCTKAHEYLFLLTKSATYWYDAEAIAEPAEAAGEFRSWNTAKKAGRLVNGGQGSGNEHPDAPPILVANTRNKRSVWTVPSAPFSEAHFATFPPALIEPCIKAGCPEKACARCGAPWVREVEAESADGRKGIIRGGKAYDDEGRPLAGDNMIDHGVRGSFNVGAKGTLKRTTLGFSPSCACDAGTAPGVCLDPFAGAGTTGLAADRLGRNAILIELNPAYATMAERRIVDDGPLFAEVTP